MELLESLSLARHREAETMLIVLSAVFVWVFFFVLLNRRFEIEKKYVFCS